MGGNEEIFAAAQGHKHGVSEPELAEQSISGVRVHLLGVSIRADSPTLSHSKELLSLLHLKKVRLRVGAF